MIKISGLILLTVLAFEGCATPHYEDGTRAGLVADRCDPHGACNIGKRP